LEDSNGLKQFPVTTETSITLLKVKIIMKKIITSICLSASFGLAAQCDSVVVAGDLSVSSTTLMSGVYVVQGTFTVSNGVTVYVTPHGSNGCGALKIYAEDIFIYGDINGDYAGYTGGTGGAKGLDVTSATGHAASLTSCTDEGSEGHVSVAGGFGGDDGNGPGAGNGGNNGQTGSGAKQYCGNFGDETGIVGGAGGAGGGAGGTYGGVGSAGGLGGDGSAGYTANNLDIENSYTVIGGNGGNGGAPGLVYGTLNGYDIALGSGGAGAGGGGRSHYLGTDGTTGGKGGGMIFLKAENNIVIEGVISANGENGNNGGNGGSGDATEDCCSDGCNGCDERTLSAGSGAGSGSGGGSGGGILIETEGDLTISGSLEAKGGNGGTGGQRGYGATCDYSGGGFCSGNSVSTEQGENGSYGGAGGGGRIKIFIPTCANANITGGFDVAGGTGGASGAVGTVAEVCDYLSTQTIEGNDITVYPNPFTSHITIQSEVEGNLEVKIFDQLGQFVLAEKCEWGSCELDLSALRSGMYFVQMSNDQGLITRKIIKE